MYDPKQPAFVPLPGDRPLTRRESRLKKFTVGEIVYVKGPAFRIAAIDERGIRIEPPVAGR